MKDSERCSVILFDEMSLKVDLSYDRPRDTVDGLVELSQKRTLPCNEALVFMVRLDSAMEADPWLLLHAQCHRSCGSAPTASHPGGEASGNTAEANGCGVRPGVNQQVTLKDIANVFIPYKKKIITYKIVIVSSRPVFWQ